MKKSAKPKRKPRRKPVLPKAWWRFLAAFHEAVNK